jgi:hypothetical protein
MKTSTMILFATCFVSIIFGSTTNSINTQAMKVTSYVSYINNQQGNLTFVNNGIEQISNFGNIFNFNSFITANFPITLSGTFSNTVNCNTCWTGTNFNSFYLQSITAGTGILVTSSNIVSLLPLKGTNGIQISNTNNIGINTLSPISNTMNSISCSSCSSNAYTAGTGLQLIGTIFSLLPLTNGIGTSVTNTNTVNLLPLTANYPISITNTNTINCNTCNGVITNTTKYVIINQNNPLP